MLQLDRARLSTARSILSRRPDYQWQPSLWVAIVAVVIVTAIHTYVAWDSVTPVIAADEIGYLANSYVIATGGDLTLFGLGFMPGVSILIAPAWWVTSDPTVVYRVAIAIGVALSLLAIWPLARLARYAGAGKVASVVMASVVMIAPARTMTSNYVLSESLLLLTTAAACVLAIALKRRPTAGTAVVFGLVVGSVVLSHGRGVAFAVAAGIWCLIAFRKNIRIALISGAVATASSIAAYEIFLWVTSQIYSDGSRTAYTFASLGKRTAVDLFGTFVGQTWYAVAAWPAIALLGLAILIYRLRTDSAALLIPIAICVTLILSTIQLQHTEAGGVPRADLWVYGRYGDHLWTIVAVMGLAVLTRVRWPAVGLAVIASAGAVGVTFLVATVPQIPAGGYWVDLHVPGIAHMLSRQLAVADTPQPWGLLTGVTLIITALLLVAGYINYSGIIVFSIYFGLLSVANNSQISDLLRSSEVDLNSFYHEQMIGDLGVIGLDHSLGTKGNLIAYGALPERTIQVDIGNLPPEVRIVYAGGMTQPPAESGALLYAPTANLLQRVWVFPGEVFDTLQADGELIDPTSALD